ncbi:unnamed protein product [Coccothraustes coccothraustes]
MAGQCQSCQHVLPLEAGLLLGTGPGEALSCAPGWLRWAVSAACSPVWESMHRPPGAAVKSFLGSVVSAARGSAAIPGVPALTGVVRAEQPILQAPVCICIPSALGR